MSSSKLKWLLPKKLYRKYSSPSVIIPFRICYIFLTYYSFAIFTQANLLAKQLKNNSSHTSLIRDKQEFKKIFESFYPALYLYASTIINDDIFIEDLVQEVFIKLWEKAEDFQHLNAVKSFLYTSVKNKCLNHIEHSKVVQKHKDFTLQHESNISIANNQIIEEETHRLIYNAINELPPGCKNVLLLSINGLKNDEIAEELNISVNSVKTQKKIAYKQLRVKLKDIYLIAGIIFGNIF